MLFTNFYSGAAVCSPSRGALLTGRNHTRLGIYTWIPPISPMHLKSEELTIPEMLKQYHYQTGHFGKWHLIAEKAKPHSQPEPIDQGFDYAFWTHNNALPSHLNPVNFIRNREKVGDIKGYSSHLLVDDAIGWIENMEGRKEPFFINIWFHEPHYKEAAPDSLKNRHKKNQEYYGAIENMDYAIGKLMSYLKKKNLDENTLVIFTSDNGSKYQGSNDPLRADKGFLYEGGIRIPFIVAWQGQITPSSTSDFIGTFTDILPTLATITHSRLPNDRIIDGIDLSDVLLGKSNISQRKEPIFFYNYYHDPICMLRQDSLILLGYQNKPNAAQLARDQYAEQLLIPTAGEGKWSRWEFKKTHMDTLFLQKPAYFELYNIKNDIGQYKDISSNYIDLTENMKTTMIKLREEMIQEGGDWYKDE